MSSTEGVPVRDPGAEDDQRNLARDGLMHLGYTLSEADRLLEGADGESAEELIGAALKRAADPSGARR